MMKIPAILLALSILSPIAALAEAKDEPGRHVLESLEKTIIPLVIFEDVSFAEAMDFVSMRLRQVQEQTHPGQPGGVSIIYNTRREPAEEPDLGGHPNALEKIETYRARDKSVLEIITDICRIAGIDAHVTSVGIVLSTAGTPPFPNTKAASGEIWRTLVAAGQKP